MGRSIAAFYTPDDGLEHALLMLDPGPVNSGLLIRDTTFSPETQGHAAAGIYTPIGTVRSVGGTYGSVDGYRYVFFFASDTGMVYWTRFSGNYRNPPRDPILTQPFLPVVSLSGHTSSPVADIAAYTRGGRLELVLLTQAGDLWLAAGQPWSGNLDWSFTRLAATVPGGRRVAVFEGAGWGHAIVANASSVHEVYYTTDRIGQVELGAFSGGVIDIGAFLTSEDGVAHIAVATPAGEITTDVYEITYIPAQVPPALRKLGNVNFLIDSIGAYEKPDKGRHMIMLESGSGSVPPVNLYLSWYYPGWAGFQYGPWPALRSW